MFLYFTGREETRTSKHEEDLSFTFGTVTEFEGPEVRTRKIVFYESL